MEKKRRDYWSEIRGIALGHRSREIMLFLFFLGVSFGFWLLQTLNETFEAEINIPLELTNVPDNIVITTQPPSVLVASVRDKGTSLRRFHRQRDRKPIELDFRKRDDGALSGRVLLSYQDLSRIVQDYLNESTAHLLTLKPDTVEYYFCRGLPVKLAVWQCGEVTTAQQNYLQGVSFSPDSVNVYAPVSVLDTMRYAYTKSVELNSLTENVTCNVDLKSMKGVKYEPEVVEMTVLVGYYTEKTVEVPIRGINFPGDKGLRTFPSKARLPFRVESSKYKSITSASFVLGVTYEELLENTHSKFRLYLKSLPEGVSNVRISPSEVDYLIEHIATEEVTQ